MYRFLSQSKEDPPRTCFSDWKSRKYHFQCEVSKFLIQKLDLTIKNYKNLGASDQFFQRFILVSKYSLFYLTNLYDLSLVVKKEKKIHSKQNQNSLLLSEIYWKITNWRKVDLDKSLFQVCFDLRKLLGDLKGDEVLTSYKKVDLRRISWSDDW